MMPTVSTFGTFFKVSISCIKISKLVLKRRKVDTASILNDEYQVYMTFRL